MGNIATPIPKSAITKDKTNQLAVECSLRFLTMKSTKKPFPVVVITENNQPWVLNHFSIVNILGTLYLRSTHLNDFELRMVTGLRKEQ